MNFISLVILTLCFSASGFAGQNKAALREVRNLPSSEIPVELKDIGITEKLGSRVSIEDLTFKDENGKEVRLAEFFAKKRPVLLNLVYFECPNLCSLVLNGLVNSLKSLNWTPGKEFEILTISIDPKEKPDLASRKKAAYLKSYGRSEAAPGWHFLTGEEKLIKKLAAEVGFGYRYVEEDRQYAHSAAQFVLTPDGKISRYLYGIDYPERDLRLALLEASNGQIGTIVDRFLLFCYHYDPGSRKYSVYLTKIMQTGCAGTVVLFGSYLAVFWRRQRRFTRV